MNPIRLQQARMFDSPQSGLQDIILNPGPKEDAKGLRDILAGDPRDITTTLSNIKDANKARNEMTRQVPFPLRAEKEINKEETSGPIKVMIGSSIGEDISLSLINQGLRMVADISFAKC